MLLRCRPGTEISEAGGHGFLNEHQSSLGMRRQQEPPKSLLVAYAEWFLLHDATVRGPG